MQILKQTNKNSFGFCPTAEVMLKVKPGVMSAETALIKWSEVFFIIVNYIILTIIRLMFTLLFSLKISPYTS